VTGSGIWQPRPRAAVFLSARRNTAHVAQAPGSSQLARNGVPHA
jgi:hypothetical protein